jgi:hypothetical protein
MWKIRKRGEPTRTVKRKPGRPVGSKDKRPRRKRPPMPIAPMMVPIEAEQQERKPTPRELMLRMLAARESAPVRVGQDDIARLFMVNGQGRVVARQRQRDDD